jgi:hypothetical protein
MRVDLDFASPNDEALTPLSLVSGGGAEGAYAEDEGLSPLCLSPHAPARLICLSGRGRWWGNLTALHLRREGQAGR